MDNQAMDRTRKLVIRDNAGNEVRIEIGDSATLNQLESLYRENTSAFGSRDLLFADTTTRRVLGDKRESIGTLWPGLDDITITAIPDTVNARG